MVETPRSSAENLSTSNEAIYWTEKNPNSKLKDIKGFLEGKNSDKVQNLKKLLDEKNYKQFQKEIGITGDKALDGKLGAKSLEQTKLYVNKEKAVDTVKTEALTLMDDIKESLIVQMQQPGEIWNTNNLYEIGKDQQFTGNFENTQKGEMGSGEWIMEKGERKLQKGVDIKGEDLTIQKISIPTFDRENGIVVREDISKTLKNVSIKYLGKNICINNEYVIHPQGTICSYKEAKFLDTYAQSGVSFYQDTLVKPLYDYLNKNRTKYEKKEYRYISDPIIANGEDNNPIKNEKPRPQKMERSELNNLEWKNINETFHGIELLSFDDAIETGYYIGNPNKDLHISSIAKKGNTLILNKGAIEVTLNKGLLSFKYWKDNYTFSFDGRSLGASGKTGNANNQREHIYKTLDRKYFG